MFCLFKQSAAGLSIRTKLPQLHAHFQVIVVAPGAGNSVYRNNLIFRYISVMLFDDLFTLCNFCFFFTSSVRICKPVTVPSVFVDCLSFSFLMLSLSLVFYNNKIIYFQLHYLIIFIMIRLTYSDLVKFPKYHPNNSSNFAACVKSIHQAFTEYGRGKQIIFRFFLGMK